MGPDDRLCSRNAHDTTVLVWDKSASRRARGWAGENVARSRVSSGHPTEMTSLPVAGKKGRGWSLLRWSGIMGVGLRAMVAVIVFVALAGSAVATEISAGRQIAIQELRERTSSFVGRDVVIAGVVDVVESITTDNFDDWRLVTPCVGSYYVTLKDKTGILDVLVKGNCLLRSQAITGPRMTKGEKVWMKVTIFLPALNPSALNPLIRAVAKDFGLLPSE